MMRLLLLWILVGLVACGEQGAKDPGALSNDSTQSAPAVAGDSTAAPVAAPVDELADDSAYTDENDPSWATAGFSDPKGFKLFLVQLRKWVDNGDKDSVANVLRYPMSNPKLKDKQQLLARYDVIFNEQVKKALREQNLQQIFRRDQGAMIGNGELWFIQSGDRFLISAINYK
ncbi:hypothetical protein [Paraflavitalea sp. CAU 1676]|uniref:hypothetical protein n=1 Tax=Paraflavitalea sp. CAU 1676 TaxID=3032598 RepID=UPI0023D99AC5|nr:hypothetical protein [Paraflavitalea sp. CAU 1676]MDF2191951.1 hypothetical protein [Paraflavitalea sp. CAU 1676]